MHIYKTTYYLDIKCRVSVCSTTADEFGLYFLLTNVIIFSICFLLLVSHRNAIVDFFFFAIDPFLRSP